MQEITLTIRDLHEYIAQAADDVWARDDHSPEFMAGVKVMQDAMHDLVNHWAKS